jgi:hypothetical protein
MFLTYAELFQLTDRKRPSSQAAILDRMGIQYVHRKDGSLAVSAAAVERILGVVRSSAPAQPREPELRF